jgi:hypothetical protein
MASPLAHMVQNPNALPVVQQILPFAISYASNTVVQMSLRYTDQRFVLLALNVMALIVVSVGSMLAEKLNLYSSKFLVDKLQFLLGLMIPIYIFQFFQTNLGSSPAPEWYEAAAYIVVLVLIVMLTVALLASDVLRSLTAAMAGVGKKKPKGRRADDDSGYDGD